MAKIYKMSDKTKNALSSGKEMRFRLITGYSIIERILKPVGSSIDGGNIRLYRDSKKLFILTEEYKKKTKEELLQMNLDKLYPDRSKSIQTVSTIGSRVEMLVERLETNGFILID